MSWSNKLRSVFDSMLTQSEAMVPGNLNWMWPVDGPVIASSNNGIVISGSAGQPVLAAAAGRVVFAGSSDADDLAVFGNFVMLTHKAPLFTYVSLYGHNRALLVAEDQMVSRGQQIAEMGSSGVLRVKLYFEIRQLKEGAPPRSMDPRQLLPTSTHIPKRSRR